MRLKGYGSDRADYNMQMKIASELIREDCRRENAKRRKSYGIVSEDYGKIDDRSFFKGKKYRRG